MSKAIPKPAADWRQQYPENVSVLQADPANRTCPHCGTHGLVFNVHFFKENRVEDLCKECAIEKAGGPEKVYVRTSQGRLESLWERNQRAVQPLHLRNARKRL